MAVAYPWVFNKGNKTSRTLAIKSAEEIAQKSGFAPIPTQVAERAWHKAGLTPASYGYPPTKSALEAFGKALHARVVIYGSASWDTRSIWILAGPKTVSTATVSVNVFDVRADKIVFSAKSVQGRSDEKENGYKLAADVLITPLVSVVSGGPATPREQRAVQIALGKAFHPWVRSELGKS